MFNTSDAVPWDVDYWQPHLQDQCGDCRAWPRSMFFVHDDSVGGEVRGRLRAWAPRMVQECTLKISPPLHWVAGVMATRSQARSARLDCMLDNRLRRPRFEEQTIEMQTASLVSRSA
jgi:hypothetical protein